MWLITRRCHQWHLCEKKYVMATPNFYASPLSNDINTCHFWSMRLSIISWTKNSFLLLSFSYTLYSCIENDLQAGPIVLVLATDRQWLKVEKFISKHKKRPVFQNDGIEVSISAFYERKINNYKIKWNLSSSIFKSSISYLYSLNVTFNAIMVVHDGIYPKPGSI